MTPDALSLIAALHRLVAVHGNADMLWQDPETGQLCPVHVHQAICSGVGKPRVYFALVPQTSDVDAGRE